MRRLAVHHGPDRWPPPAAAPHQPAGESRRNPRHVTQEHEDFLDALRQCRQPGGQAGGDALAVTRRVNDPRARQAVACDRGDPRAIRAGHDNDEGNRGGARGVERVGEQGAPVERSKQLIRGAEAARRSGREDDRNAQR